MTAIRMAIGLGAVLVAGCGGGGAKPAAPPTTAAPPAGDDLEARYDACGMITTKDVSESGLLAKDPETLTPEEEAMMSADPAMQTPKDVAACLAFVRGAMAARASAEHLAAASDISYGLCEGQRVGEACYHKALYRQWGVWDGENSDPEQDAREITLYLESGCEYGYQPACDVRATGKDSEGKVWSVLPK
jgi:hypothetical protein